MCLICEQIRRPEGLVTKLRHMRSTPPHAERRVRRGHATLTVYADLMRGVRSPPLSDIRYFSIAYYRRPISASPEVCC
jgi:hypothetical protein